MLHSVTSFTGQGDDDIFYSTKRSEFAQYIDTDYLKPYRRRGERYASFYILKVDGDIVMMWADTSHNGTTDQVHIQGNFTAQSLRHQVLPIMASTPLISMIMLDPTQQGLLKNIPTC